MTRKEKITIIIPVDYMARDVMILMGANSRATGGGGPENRDFLGPEMATREASAIPLVIIRPEKVDIFRAHSFQWPE
jgi:hypothetical protein